jgi:CheY-like chemotaxis protein
MGSSAEGFILVVEDDEDVREFAVRVLRDSGYHVLEAVNGGVALVLLEQDLPIDLLFTDIVMPGEPDGIGLAERAKAMRPDLRVLYATGFAGSTRLDEHNIYGKVLGKPYRPQQLASEVARLLASHDDAAPPSIVR